MITIFLMPLQIEELCGDEVRQVNKTKQTVPGQVVFVILLAYVLQARELRRFFQQLKSEKKESQVSNILDSNVDAIIVVKSEELSNAKLIENGEVPLDFVLCNN